MTDAVQIEYDDSDLIRAVRQLATRLPDRVDRLESSTARDTAALVRSGVPVRSGRLAGTVRPLRDGAGAAVAYGGTLPYAGYIEGRTHAVARAVVVMAPRFVRAMVDAADQEVNAL